MDLFFMGDYSGEDACRYCIVARKLRRTGYRSPRGSSAIRRATAMDNLLSHFKKLGFIPCLHRNQCKIHFVSFRVRVKQDEFLPNCYFGIHPYLKAYSLIVIFFVFDCSGEDACRYCIVARKLRRAGGLQHAARGSSALRRATAKDNLLSHFK
jgi:hypothetical protein